MEKKVGIVILDEASDIIFKIIMPMLGTKRKNMI